MRAVKFMQLLKFLIISVFCGLVIWLVGGAVVGCWLICGLNCLICGLNGFLGVVMPYRVE